MSRMLQGILNMPLPDDPAKLDPMMWLQVKDLMREASIELTRLETENARLQGLLDTIVKGNDVLDEDGGTDNIDWDRSEIKLMIQASADLYN